MIDRADIYCNLFVDTNSEQDILVKNLAELFNVSADDWGNIETAFGEISIIENDDYDKSKRKDEDEGFLFYRYLLEIEPKADLPVNNAIKFVSKILEQLWSLGYPATAACNYEDNLPYNGKFIPTNSFRT